MPKTFVGKNRHPTLFCGGGEEEASPSLPPSLLVWKGESFGIVVLVVQTGPFVIVFGFSNTAVYWEQTVMGPARLLLRTERVTKGAIGRLIQSA